jgi:hypothetical protein
MIKKQYDYYQTEKTYFTNFMDSLATKSNVQSARFGRDVRAALAPYKATLAKSKAKYRYNIKWHDTDLYLLFVLRFS